jgi:hypothetical protein
MTTYAVTLFHAVDQGELLDLYDLRPAPSDTR